MKSAYFLPLARGLAEVDLWHIGDNTWMVSRVIVPARHRGKGFARQLMREVLCEADAEGVTLLLEINPYGDMTYGQLRDWYMRLGFRECGPGVYRRVASTGANV